MLLNRSDCVDKVAHIVSDQMKFAKALGEKDKTKTIKDQLTGALRKLVDENLISRHADWKGASLLWRLLYSSIPFFN